MIMNLLQVCVCNRLRSKDCSVSDSVSPLSLFTADGWRQVSGRLGLMKYEMLGACLNYDRFLDLTCHYAHFAAETDKPFITRT